MTDDKVYLTFLTSDSYIYGVELLKASLDSVGTKYPLYCAITDDVSSENIKLLSKMGINYFKVDKIPTPDNIMTHNKNVNEHMANTWKYALTKLKAFSFTQFKKIIMVDCDILVLKNLDHCFEMPHMTAALDGEYFNLWPTWPHFNTGFVVIEPKENEFNKIVDFINSIDPDSLLNSAGSPYVIADQEILNIYNKEWVKSGNKLSKYYNVFAPHVGVGIEDDILENAYFIHYTGIKPWYLDQEKLSPLLKTELTDHRSYVPYAVGAAIINLYSMNNFKLNLEDEKNSGKFDYQISLMLADRFRAYSDAKKYALKALAKDNSNQDFIELNRYVDSLITAEKHSKQILPLLKEMYCEVQNSGCPSLTLYSDIALMEPLRTNLELDLVEQYWNILKNAVIQYIEEKTI